jgi:hypothetical protein
MQILGELVTVGDMASEDAPEILGIPAVQIRAAEGRIITITGLTRAEARAAAEHFGDQVSVNLTAAA